MDSVGSKAGLSKGRLRFDPVVWTAEDNAEVAARMRRYLVLLGLSLAALVVFMALGVAYPNLALPMLAAQSIALVAILIVLARTLICARDCVSSPLARVRQWASEIRQGDFGARLPTPDSPELEGLSDDVNRLAEWLESLAADQEAQMQKQQGRLAEKSRSLELLYDVASGINTAPDVDILLTQFLGTLSEVMGSDSAVVLVTQTDGHLRRTAGTGDASSWESLSRLMTAPEKNEDESGTPMDAIERISSVASSRPAWLDGYHVVTVPLIFSDRLNGVYRLLVDDAHSAVSEDFGNLLTSIGKQLGMAVEKARLDRESDRLSRMEERALLANELHDSLAQTLASLRFQVRVLDDTLRQDNESAIWQEMERIEASLDEANTELRELIAYFRAPIDRRGLIPALETAVSRFRKESGIEAVFQNQWDNRDLPSEHEVQITRIVQEALANIRKHSEADMVRVLLTRARDEAYRVVIEDDGLGIALSETDRGDLDHFGLSIMQERAARIDGELRIESEPGEGTRVVVTFKVGEDLAVLKADRELESCA